MKNITRVLTIVCCALLLCGCTNESTPTSEHISIARLRQHYGNYPTRITQPWYIVGRITSCDREGNFYKTIVVEDATNAIEINVNDRQLHLTAPWCSTIELYVEGMWIGAYGRSIVVGAEPTGTFPVDDLDARDFARRLRVVNRSDSLYHPTPRTISQLTRKDNQHWIIFDSVQFISEEIGLAWGCNTSTTFRHIISPVGDTLRVATSAYATWRNAKLPEGSGSIDGILYYRSGNYELWPTSIVRANMNLPRFEVR